MEVVALASTGRIRAHARRFSLGDAMDAYRALRDGTLQGRAVIVPS
jgi:propanol-preferring alcohol dehydrogenase